jgi:tetratricopeptide (TPR) repeat protein
LTTPSSLAGALESGTADRKKRYAAAVEALNRGDWPRAKALSMSLLHEIPQHAGVHFVAGVAALQMKQTRLATEWLGQSVALNPQRSDYMVQYALALATMRLPGDAVRVADRAWALSPEGPVMFDTLGVVYAQANTHAKAVAAFRMAVGLAPDVAVYRFNLGMSLLFSGDFEAAEQELETCLAINPHYWKAHLSLAQLRCQTRAENHLERLHALLPLMADDDATGQMCINLALAKEYEDLEDYQRSFEHLARGKSAGRIGRGYSIERDEALFAALIESFPDPQATDSGFHTEEPIFVLGMPRSGTTLVERIVSCHPDVESAGELLNFGVALKRLSGTGTPRLVDPATVHAARDVDLGVLGAEYLASTRPLSGKTPRFIDKLPHNFLYAGFIAKALPDAKIICLRRDPLDTCVSNFRQGFGQASPFHDYAFDLLDTGRYYVLFDRLMAHWQRVFPGRILEIRYETIVEAQEHSSRRLLEFCGLPWHEACLRFEDNQAPVSSASAVQVRSPIHRSGIKRWKRYEPQLVELKALLRDAGIAIDD